MLILDIPLYVVDVHMPIGLYSSIVYRSAIGMWLYKKCRQGTSIQFYVCTTGGNVQQSEKFFRRLIGFNLNRATLLFVLGNALGEHAFNNCPDGHVLLPGDSPDLCYEVLVADAREVADLIRG